MTEKKYIYMAGSRNKNISVAVWRKQQAFLRTGIFLEMIFKYTVWQARVLSLPSCQE